MSKKVFIPVAWPYANGPRHIGHVAGFGVPSDVFARYQRMIGNDVLMVSGTDEHGTPIVMEAEKQGVTPQQIVDKNNRIIVEDLVNLGLTYDIFTRTTTENHKSTVQEVFTTLFENGYIFEGDQQVAVSPSSNHTLPDRYINGICPICEYKNARGDQCDNCGKQLDPTDLIEPWALDKDGNKETPIFKSETHFFLDLPALKDSLRDWLETKKDWRPNVIKFSLGLLDELRPRAVSRDISWGVTIPLEEYKNNDNKKLYVWFDAVIGYLSASIEWARRNNKKWEDFWLDENVPSYYFMGKDNITFHSQIWPSELLGYQGKGDKGKNVGKFGKLNLPTEIVSSEFLTIKGEKFSSSRNIVIYVKDFLRVFDADSLRYYIAVAGPEMQDSNFTFEDFYSRINSELVASWGNLVNRTLNIIHKKFGQVPNIDNLEKEDEDLIGQIKNAFETVGKSLQERKMRSSIVEIMKLSQNVNQYLATNEPWKLEDNNPRLAQIMWTSLQCIVDINTMMSPFLPHSSRKIYLACGFSSNKFNVFPKIEEVKDLDNESSKYPIITGDYVLNHNIQKWESISLPKDQIIDKPSPIFKKLDITGLDDIYKEFGLV